jgi:vacuolar-type H+-ATPase subunit H
MAGEAIEKIKGSEEEAVKILEKAKGDAKKLLDATARKKEKLIAEKREALKADEAEINEEFKREIEEAVRDIDEEEKRDIESVDTLCGGNVQKVVSYIIEEIVEE